MSAYVGPGTANGAKFEADEYRTPERAISQMRRFQPVSRPTHCDVCGKALEQSPRGRRLRCPGECSLEAKRRHIRQTRLQPPVRRVVCEVEREGWLYDWLECGHERPITGAMLKRRACIECEPEVRG